VPPLRVLIMTELAKGITPKEDEVTNGGPSQDSGARS